MPKALIEERMIRRLDNTETTHLRTRTNNLRKLKIRNYMIINIFLSIKNAVKSEY